MTQRWKTFGVVLATVTSAAWGCSQAPTPDEHSAAASHQAILNGTEATDAKYSAVGALMYESPWGLDVACSGTLIANKAVLTARNCMKYVDAAQAAGKQAYFAF